MGVSSLADLDTAASAGGPRAEAMASVLRELGCLPDGPTGHRQAKPRRSGWWGDSLRERHDYGADSGGIEDATLWDEVDEAEELGNERGRSM